MRWQTSEGFRPSQIETLNDNPCFNMFTPTITPEGLALEIVCRMLGSRFVTLNDLQNAFRDMQSMQRVMNVLLNPMPGQLITPQDLNSAMTELLTAYNRNTDKNPNLNMVQKEAAKLANYAFVSMVHDAILSGLRIVAVQ